MENQYSLLHRRVHITERLFAGFYESLIASVAAIALNAMTIFPMLFSFNVSAHIKTAIPYQLRAMHDEREWSQADLGEEAGKPQNVISRLESPGSGYPSIKTLLELAYALDVALVIKFVPFSRFVREFDDVSPAALSAKEFEKDRKALQKWATESRPAVSQSSVKKEAGDKILPFQPKSQDSTSSPMSGSKPSTQEQSKSGLLGDSLPSMPSIRSMR